ncbi:MAG: glutaredoxin family protein [Gammaproteobacteria bacterium]|nr:MAG: glutaredoxin family protein [Gammaproteobacteria bacterium]RLA22096.1 MAG: glutaredoxin family protein [Gammaproteobacteria bacterium]
MVKLILYGTDGCHLCEEAEVILNRLLEKLPMRFKVEQCDITTADELMALYGIRIPVIKNGQSGNELGWPFDEQQLRDFLLVD